MRQAEHEEHDSSGLVGRSVGESSAQPPEKRASVADLVDAGLLREDEKLYATLRSRHQGAFKEFEAELVGGEQVRILSDGGDGSLNGTEFGSPSGAIAALYGRPDSSWKNWKVDRGGQRVLLETIRAEYNLAQENAALPPRSVAARDDAAHQKPRLDPIDHAASSDRDLEARVSNDQAAISSDLGR